MTGRLLQSRYALAGILLVCSIVVLGLSAHVETSVRTFGVTTATFSYDCFIAAFTILVEVVMGVARLKTDTRLNALSTEVAIMLLLWLMWLAAGIATTRTTEEGRGFCKNIDDLTKDPELADLDPALLEIAKSALKSACSELHAELAFIWISWILVTALVGSLVWFGLRKQKRIGASVWKSHIRNLDNGSADPFVDPAGSGPGLSVGVPRDEEEGWSK